jgi:hypothetical protein
MPPGFTQRTANVHPSTQTKSLKQITKLKTFYSTCFQANSTWLIQHPAMAIDMAIKAQLCNREKLLPPSKSLFGAYENQRDLFLILVQLNLCQIISKKTFYWIWAKAIVLKLQHLFSEVIACGNLVVGDIASAIVIVGDFEVQSLLYYE